MIGQDTVQGFLEVLSSKAPVPGGGGASAIGGAMGNALGQMVANLTIGKKRYADVEEEIRGLLEKMEGMQQAFLQLADEDARVFAPLAAAYSLPAGTEEEKAHKEQVMEENLLAASLVPLEIMEKAAQMLDILEVLGEKGSKMAVSDVGVGVQFIRTALTGAVSHFALGGAPDWGILLLCVLFTLLWARLAARFANKASPATLNRATGVILVVLGAAILSVNWLR